jgi:hypothetical protein
MYSICVSIYVYNRDCGRNSSDDIYCANLATAIVIYILYIYNIIIYIYVYTYIHIIHKCSNSYCNQKRTDNINHNDGHSGNRYTLSLCSQVI